MEINSIVFFLACVICLFLLCKVLVLPIKKIFKLLTNSLLGVFFIVIINVLGEGFNLHIGVNIITSLFIGIFGIPGVALLVILKIMI